MTHTLKITLAQLNPVAGDIRGNAGRALQVWEQARQAGSQLLLLPELFLVGGPCSDLAADPPLVAAAAAEVEALAARTADGPAIAIGAPVAIEGGVFNALHILEAGKVQARIRKHRLAGPPGDEARRFLPGPISGPCPVAGARIGFPVGDDALDPDTVESLSESGTELLLVPAAMAYARGGFAPRQQALVARVVESDLPLVFLNAVGTQDALTCDGGSFVLNRGGRLAVQLPLFDEAVVHVDFTRVAEGWQAEPGDKALFADETEQDYRVLVESLRDYLAKIGSDRALLGLSGGVDSALVATIAADAIGPDRVRALILPSEYTSRQSLDDAQAVASRLGIRSDTVSIDGGRAALMQALAPLFAGTRPDLTEENLQARLRGVLLMALSNKFGGMLLSTGNKSEVAVGYATLYGDTCGGWNPLKDLYKTRVFAICRWRNGNHRRWMRGPAGEVIPPGVIAKPPSAELRPGQKDEDSLPPYAVLDPILEGLIEREASVAALVAEGHDRETVQRVAKLIVRAEFKRAQAAPGPRLTARAFGIDRHFPIVNHWRDES